MEEDLQRILTVGEECISEKELRSLILSKGRGVDEDGELMTDDSMIVLVPVGANNSIHSKTSSPQNSPLRRLRTLWTDAYRPRPT